MGLAFAVRAWSQESDSQAGSQELVKQEVFREVAPGALLIRDSSEVILTSAEDGSKLIGKIGWKAGSFRMGLEASARLQEGAEEVELLNLDGVSGGATVSGQISYVHLQKRKGEHFSAVCDEHQRLVACNLRLDRTGDSSGAKRGLELCSGTCEKIPLIAPEECTIEGFEKKKALSDELAKKALPVEGCQRISVPWDELAENASQEALNAACAELSKLTGQAPLPEAFSRTTAELWPLKVSQTCDKESLKKAAEAAVESWMVSKSKELEDQAQKLETEADRLAKTAASVSDERVKGELKGQSEQSSRAAVKARAEKASLRPPLLLEKPEAWLEAKGSEKLKLVCQSFNAPSADLFLNTTGNDNECDLQTLLARAEKIPSAHRAYLRRIAVERSNWIPWTFTVRGSTARQGFNFVEMSNLDKTIKQSENNTSLGVYASTLFAGTRFSLGVERKRAFEGKAKTTLCRPLAGTDAQVCNPAVIGAPEAAESEVGRFEIRRFVASDFALAGRYLYDFDKKDWETHALLYFLRSEKKGLNGGIDLSYDSTDEWNARLFIGTSFSLEG